MNYKIEVTIDVISHATEDFTKFFVMFEKLFGIKEDEFLIQNLKGHFDNPIVILHTKLVKNEAKTFVEKIISGFNNKGYQELMESLESRIQDSSVHFRLDKQKLIQGKIGLMGKDSVRVRVFTPIYNKKNSIEIFSKLLKKSN